MSTLAEALAPRSDQLNADDLIPGPRVIKITGARILRDGRDTKIVLNFEGDNGKPWKPCKTMGRAMVMVWAITDEQQLVGKSLRLYRDPDVKFGDQGAVGGIRISHMSDIDKPANVKLTVSQGKKSLFVFHPLVTEADSANRQQPKQTPEEWTANYIAQVEAVPVLDALIALQSRSARALTALEAQRPDLHRQAIEAGTKRAAKLAPPHEREGRDDGDMGEGFNGVDDPFASGAA